MKNTGKRYFNIEEISESDVPPAKGRVSSFIAQIQPQWDDLIEAISTDRREGGALKIELELAIRDLKGIKHPEKVVLRKLKEYVRERNLLRKIVLREGVVYVTHLEKKKRS